VVLPLHHLARTGPGGGERDPEVLEPPGRLHTQVASPDHVAIAVDCDLPRDVDDLAAACRDDLAEADPLEQLRWVEALLLHGRPSFRRASYPRSPPTRARRRPGRPAGVPPARGWRRGDDLRA